MLFRSLSTTFEAKQRNREDVVSVSGWTPKPLLASITTKEMQTKMKTESPMTKSLKQDVKNIGTAIKDGQQVSASDLALATRKLEISAKKDMGRINSAVGDIGVEAQNFVNTYYDVNSSTAKSMALELEGGIMGDGTLSDLRSKLIAVPHQTQSGARQFIQAYDTGSTRSKESIHLSTGVENEYGIGTFALDDTVATNAKAITLTGSGTSNAIIFESGIHGYQGRLPFVKELAGMTEIGKRPVFGLCPCLWLLLPELKFLSKQFQPELFSGLYSNFH